MRIFKILWFKIKSFLLKHLADDEPQSVKITLPRQDMYDLFDQIRQAEPAKAAGETHTNTQPKPEHKPDTKAKFGPAHKKPVLPDSIHYDKPAGKTRVNKNKNQQSDKKKQYKKRNTKK